MKNHTRFTVRCTLAERADLEVKSGGGDLSKYVRAVLFEGESQAMLDLQARIEELREDQAVLRAIVRELVNEGRELKAAPPPQPQPIAAPAQDNSRLEGMMLELLLLQRGSSSRTNLNAVQSEVERQKLPVHGNEPYEPMVKTVANPPEQRPQAAVERLDPPARENRNQGGPLRKWLG
jgi:hypothetical protein